MPQTLLFSVAEALPPPCPAVRRLHPWGLISSPFALIPMRSAGNSRPPAGMGPPPAGMICPPRHSYVLRCLLGLVPTAYNCSTFGAGMGHLLAGMQRPPRRRGRFRPEGPSPMARLVARRLVRPLNGPRRHWRFHPEGPSPIVRLAARRSVRPRGGQISISVLRCTHLALQRVAPRVAPAACSPSPCPRPATRPCCRCPQGARLTPPLTPLSSPSPPHPSRRVTPALPRENRRTLIVNAWSIGTATGGVQVTFLCPLVTGLSCVR